MKMRIIQQVTAVFAAGTMLFAAPEARAQRRVGLDSVLTVIREQHPMMKSYAARGEAMAAYAQGAGSLMAPEAGGGLWMVPYRRTEDPRDKGQIMLSVQQRITNPAKLKANKRYLESKQAIERESQNEIYNELKAAAKAAWYQWVILERRKRVLNQSEAILTLMLTVARERYPNNQGTLGNIYKAEGRLEEIRNMILENDNQIVQQNITLNRLMNIPTVTRFAIDTTIQMPRVTILDSLAERRSDVRGIDRRIESVRLNQELERSQAKPDFNLSFNHMIARGSGMPNQFMLLGMVSIPLAPWSSKIYKSNIVGMGREIESLKNEREAILNEAGGMSSGMMAELETLEKQLGNYQKRIIPVLRRNYSVTLLSYQENKSELPIVLDAWEAMNASQLVYLETFGKYYQTLVTYEKQYEF